MAWTREEMAQRAARELTDGAYYLIVTPQAGGSEVALIVNNGR